MDDSSTRCVREAIAASPGTSRAHEPCARLGGRALAMLSFRTPNGGSFDGVALNIESTRLRNVALRSQRAVTLARQLRRRRGRHPLAIVPFNPRGLERRPSTWPRFPWEELAAKSDAFAPMIYTGGAYEGFDATYGYVTRALRLLRSTPATPRSRSTSQAASRTASGPEELAGLAAAVEDDGATIGVSPLRLDDDPFRALAVLARSIRRPGLAHAVARHEQMLRDAP